MSKLKFYQVQPFDDGSEHYDVIKKRLLKNDELIAKVTFVPNQSLDIKTIIEVNPSDLKEIQDHFKK